MFIRYSSILALASFNLAVFYIVFTPLTVYPVYWSVKIFYSSAQVFNSVIVINGISAELIPACVAGSAYYLLTILNLSTPMRTKQRIYSLIFLFISFLIINILRIVLFLVLLIYNADYFDLAHRIVWYFGSTAMVVLLWFACVWVCKIDKIPLYSDGLSLVHDAFKKRIISS